MSVRMIEALKFAPVSPTQKLVLFVLADCHNEQNLRCDPSYTYLMKITGLSNRAIANALKALRQAGYVQFSSQNGSRSSYTLNPQTSEPDDTKPVNDGHRSNGSTCERGSQPPVNLVPRPVNVVPKAVNEGHINRKEPEGTGRKPEGKSRRGGWQEEFKLEADESSAIELPPEWSDPLRKMVKEFFDHRHDMATKPKTKSDAKPWTRRAASATVSQVSTALQAHGETAVLARIQSAIAGSWQGLHFDKLNTNGNSHSYGRTSSPQQLRPGSLNHGRTL